MTENIEDKRDQVDAFLMRNFPQIQMHGGASQVDEIKEDGTVWISLGGACSGCGISPMTIQAIQNRLPQQVEWVTDVHVSTLGGFGGGTMDQTQSHTEEGRGGSVDAPF